MKPIITIYSDGACRGNPGDGGWGALLISGTNEKSICGGERNTTNNRMELLAVIKALEIIKQSSDIQIYTDSTYVQRGLRSGFIIGNVITGRIVVRKLSRI